MCCGVYSLRANYTQTIHEAYIERLRVKETKRQRVGESTVNGLPQPLPKGKGFVAALMHRTWGSCFGDEETESGREGFSLEGCTVSAPGQRPGIAGGKERLAWRVVRPRRWRREPQTG